MMAAFWLRGPFRVSISSLCLRNQYHGSGGGRRRLIRSVLSSSNNNNNNNTWIHSSSRKTTSSLSAPPPKKEEEEDDGDDEVSSVSGSGSINRSTVIRLSKRMGELDLCSRREADRWIRDGRVSVDGIVATLGQKVSSDLKATQIQISNTNNTNNNNTNTNKDHENENVGQNNNNNNEYPVVIVLNKPSGYVSGQAEHGHTPAIRLLTQDRMLQDSQSNDETTMATMKMVVMMMMMQNTSWKGFAPAGRLDLESKGLLVFCESGVVAKKLIQPNSKIEKEYLVDVEPAHQVTKRERSIDPTFVLPKPPTEENGAGAGADLNVLFQTDNTLLGDHRPLRPCRDAQWIVPGRQLRITLMEGRKHQIRRVCRELLGYHVVRLKRIRIGPIRLKGLPEGCWRPLTKSEVDELLSY